MYRRETSLLFLDKFSLNAGFDFSIFFLTCDMSCVSKTCRLFYESVLNVPT